MSILEVKNLKVFYNLPFVEKGEKQRQVQVVSDVSFSLEEGEILAIVGESGAGKSTIGHAILSALKEGGYAKGEIFFQGTPITHLSDEEIRYMRGNDIGVVVQDPFSSLNPILTVQSHLLETIKKASDIAVTDYKQKMYELLDAVGLPATDDFLERYPFQISGGQSQRVVIALAIALSPKILIADEPTTALDVFVQDQILDLMKSLVDKYRMAMILITHNMGVVYKKSDRIIVMKNSMLVEEGSPDNIFIRPHKQYTRMLIGSLPPKDRTVDVLFSTRNWNTKEEQENIKALDLDYQLDIVSAHTKSMEKQSYAEDNTPVLACNKVSFSVYQNLLSFKQIFQRLKSNASGGLSGSADERIKTKLSFKNSIQILDSVSFEIQKGASHGLIGESGSGKSTIAKLIAGLHRRPSGIVYEGKMLSPKEIQTDIQMIFQSPYSSLNPKKTLRSIWTEAIKIRNPHSSIQEIERKCTHLLDLIQLDKGSLDKYPQAFSGGQLQRICIARVLVLSPKLILCDEPTSALDISVQADILNLLKYIQQTCHISMLFISHDLPVVRYMCNTISVIKDGKIVETQERESLFNNPQHTYTAQLLDLIPSTPLLVP